MRGAVLLKALMGWKRAERGVDSREVARLHCIGRFAGLQVQQSYHIVAVHDLSEKGVCIEAPKSLHLSAMVKVTSGKLKRVGRVVWIANGRAGIEFGQQPRWSELLG
jgi:hypothetical protein